MSILLFIIILLVLVFVHELGHFSVAKFFKIKVTEFALGFPPKLFSWKRGETVYSLNIVPFGGFVRIHGENPDLDNKDDHDRSRNMSHKPWYVQAAVLIAGVTFNIIFAWMLVAVAFMFGYPTALDDMSTVPVQDPQVMILQVSPGSPADLAMIKSGDVILRARNTTTLVEPRNVEDVKNVIKSAWIDTPVTLELEKGGDVRTVEVVPVAGIVEGSPAIGISMSTVGVIRYPFFQAIFEGGKMTLQIFRDTFVGLGKLVLQSFRGQASLDSVTGPVGIVGMVGDASQFGVLYLLGFTALISINLAVINLVPFPALDGGRLFVVLIEAVSRRKVPARIQGYINGIGFLLLITLMLVITWGDVARLLK